jgi:hypothetical protein
MCDRFRLDDGTILRFTGDFQRAGLKPIRSPNHNWIDDGQGCSCHLDIESTAIASGLVLVRGDGVTCEWRMTRRHAGQSGLS